MSYSVVLRGREIADATGSQVVMLSATPGNVKVRWSRIVARDITHQPTRIELLLIEGAAETVLHASQPAAAAITVEVKSLGLVSGVGRIAARFVGATTADQLEVVAIGDVVTE